VISYRDFNTSSRSPYDSSQYGEETSAFDLQRSLLQLQYIRTWLSIYFVLEYE